VRRWNDFTQVVNEKEIQKELIPELMQMFAVSDFAADTCCHYSNILFDLIETGDLERSYTRQDYKNKLSSMHTYTQDEDLMVFLRKYRRREMLRIAWRDLTQVAELSETLADLTQMADCLLTEVLEILYNRQAEILGYPASISGKRQKLYIIAAGKLGGLELNFSSDVDLIFVYPEDWLTEDVEEPISNQEFFTRLAQRFIKVLNTPTADGFVYRVDMRLRPYGEGGPLVMSLPALQSYFHEQARDWERYALVKARVLAPPDQSVRTLENMMNQFVYRRYVDFGVIEALRQMKQKIQQEVRSKRLQDDIKRGPGGIRQVEFVVQAFQLMRGGLKPFLQQRHLLTALNYLKDKHALGDAVVELGQAYQFLRRSEHCLQMVSDSQTHALPNEPWSQLRLAYAMGFNNWEDFLTQLNIYREYVQNYFERFLAKKQYSQIENLNDEWFQQLLNSWKLKFADSAMAYQLTQLGFPSGEETRVILSEFADSYRCTNLSALGRERLNQLMPILLQLVVKTKNPMETLNRIILLLEA
ncbi:MAG: bifunctional [glutamate--ammonia ligase]-adenylyl-L-tyrosine phosphorylase/[glutamate--ammonia-ligase] adenylyltransferase, partial [Proteobacteria bacterium]|nr:bifunctional [glutamate--ammonia ligase]-adenylyl-L-tyrosine phosphorylase/[glutamate--ammonia-ligase] adenylyltransferase [Pseudomonadota bacterium]